MRTAEQVFQRSTHTGRPASRTTFSSTVTRRSISSATPGAPRDAHAGNATEHKPRLPVGDVRMAKDDAHNVRRKTKIAEQCRHGTAEIVSVPA